MVNARAILKLIKSCFFSNEQSSESAALIGSNDDMLTEILLRLPANSIIRFKSVSKHWRSLLSHNFFTLRYDSLLKTPGFFVDGVYVPFDVENPSNPPFRSLDACFRSRGIRIPYSGCRVRIAQSCNGLLLCYRFYAPDVRKYYVFNPITKQIAEIPPPHGYPASTPIICMNLAFHPGDDGHYKIVCILTQSYVVKLCQIQIYSSDTGKWKISIESFNTNLSISPLIFTFEKGVYWNGAIHWVLDRNKYLYFDVTFGLLQTCPSPKELLSDENAIVYLGESSGHLHLVLTNEIRYYIHSNLLRKFRSCALKVYEMLNDYSGWFVKYEVEFHELAAAFPAMIYPSFGYYYSVMDVIRGEKEEDTFIVLRIPGKMIRYNIHDKSFKEICADTNNCDGYYRYTEALTSFYETV